MTRLSELDRTWQSSFAESENNSGGNAPVVLIIAGAQPADAESRQHVLGLKQADCNLRCQLVIDPAAQRHGEGVSRRTDAGAAEAHPAKQGVHERLPFIATHR